MTGLPSRIRQAMATAGFAAADSSWAFRRYALERRDLAAYDDFHRMSKVNGMLLRSRVPADAR